MNTVYLVIWFTISGQPAMVQHPIEARQCLRQSGLVVLPAGAEVDCMTPKQAAQAIWDGNCTLVNVDRLQEQYICRKGVK